MKTTIISLLFILLLLQSCSTQSILSHHSISDINGKKDTLTFKHNESEYKIKTGDKISISVWDQEDLSVGSVYGIYNSNEIYGKWLMVDKNGNIEIPRIGTTKVEQLTTCQLKDSLKSVFKTWLINPIVDVKILNKEITILGEVKSPGKITVEKEINYLTDLIAYAGGTDFYANLKKIRVIRKEGSKVKSIDIDLTNDNDFFLTNIAIYPGDIIIVTSKWNKNFDKRISTVIPITATLSAVALILNFFK